MTLLVVSGFHERKVELFVNLFLPLPEYPHLLLALA